MRSLVALAFALVLPLAGCLSDDRTAADVAGPADGRPSDDGALPVHPEGTPEFCESEEDSGDGSPCDFWDEDYHEYVVYDLDTPVIDVLIVPPASPDAMRNTEGARLAVQQWEDGIRHFAQPWFNESFDVTVAVVGLDVPSIDSVQDPEIVVVSTGALGILGIGLEPKQLGCQLISEGNEARSTYPVHAHHGMEVRAQDCTGTGFTCFALNFGGAEAFGLYDLIAHEVGHCLGAGHVGDALDFRSRYAPVEDIMSYQNNATQVHCVSTMNVRVLEGVYAHLLDQPEEMWLPRGSYYAMSPLDYRQAPCANP